MKTELIETANAQLVLNFSGMAGAAQPIETKKSPENGRRCCGNCPCRQSCGRTPNH